MDDIALQKIKDEQDVEFNTVEETDKFGVEKKKGQYKQILKSEGLGYWVDVYDGPHGKGYVIREERVVDRKTEQKTVNTGPEDYREEDWREIS